ncbi:MAG: NAD(P)-dependent oxidoreductase [Paraperlucidibaca sp.]
MAALAFIGLGVMGFPMAGHLQRAGHQVTVWNRSEAKAIAWVARYQGQRAASAREAAAAADIVLTCVGRDEDIAEVVRGADGIAAGLKRGGLIVDHSTVSAAITRTLAAELAELGIDWVDAPVSGGQQGAENAQLSIFCGGSNATVARAHEVLSVYAKAQAHIGECGQGQLAKMVNQICVAGVIEGLAEGIYFAQQAGLDVAKVMPLVGQGAGSSWQLLNRYHTMLADSYEHGFAVDWMRKDLAIVLAEAQALGLELPATELIDGFYADVQRLGGGRWDTSSLLRRLQEKSR